MIARHLVWIALVACAPQREPSSIEPPPTRTVVTSGFDLEGRAAAPPPRLEVTQSEGLPPERVRAIFAPAAEPVQRCVAGQSGKITVRVTSRDGELHVAVAPAASLDPRARACAFDALTAVYHEETASSVGGPAVPPSGFTSLLTVSW